MFVIIAFAVGLLVFTAASLAIVPLDSLYARSNTERIRNDMTILISAIEQRYEENPAGGYLDPEALVLIPGYEHLNILDVRRFQFNSVEGLNDGVWLFNRSAMWFESPHGYVGNDEYLKSNNNTCGAGDFSNASNWCGRVQSIWGKLESKGNHSTQLLAEKQRLYRTIGKFYQHFNKDGTFLPIADGQVASLAQLAGYTGTAYDCGGVFVYNEIPFTCNDFFNYWGDPIIVNKISRRHIALVSRTQVASASGQSIRIAEEAKLE